METRTINDSFYFTFINHGFFPSGGCGGRWGSGLCRGWHHPNPTAVLQGWCSGVQLPGDPPESMEESRTAAQATSHHPFAQHQRGSGLASSGHAHELLMKTPSRITAEVALSPGWVTHSLRIQLVFYPILTVNSNKYSPHKLLPFALLPSKACSPLCPHQSQAERGMLFNRHP